MSARGCFMTASPTPTAAVPGDVGLPSEEGAIAAYNAVWQAAPAVDAHNVNIVRREAMAAVYALIRPAFEAKEREIERYEAMIKAEQDAAIHWCGEGSVGRVRLRCNGKIGPPPQRNDGPSPEGSSNRADPGATRRPVTPARRSPVSPAIQDLEVSRRSMSLWRRRRSTSSSSASSCA